MEVVADVVRLTVGHERVRNELRLGLFRPLIAALENHLDFGVAVDDRFMVDEVVERIEILLGDVTRLEWRPLARFGHYLMSHKRRILPALAITEFAPLVA